MLLGQRQLVDLPARGPERILLIRPSALGDVCRSTRLAEALKARFPAARLDWLVQDSFAPAVAYHPAVDQVILFERKRFEDGLGAKRAVVADLRRRLRENRYEVVIDAQGLFRSGLMALATNAPIRIGHADAREFGWLGYTHKVITEQRHTVDRMLALLEPLGIPLARSRALPGRLIPPPDALAWRAAQPWASRRTIVLAPTSRWPAKMWPADRFCALAVGLLRQHPRARILVVGGPGEQPQCQPLLALSAADHRVVSLVGATSIGQLMATIAGASLVVANDSAAVHLAAGLSVPLVGLYGPTDVQKVGPYQRSGDVIQVRADGDHFNHKDAASVSMMERITTEVVLSQCLAKLVMPK